MRPDDLEGEQAMVEFPMAIGAEGDKVGEVVDDGDKGIIGKTADRTDMTDFDMLVITAVAAYAGEVGVHIVTTC
jgi:hypothetical protein